jgi:hypothetical protein
MPSNTAFRGFGGPQTVLLAEMWLEKLADAAGMLPEQMRELFAPASARCLFTCISLCFCPPQRHHNSGPVIAPGLNDSRV